MLLLLNILDLIILVSYIEVIINSFIVKAVFFVVSGMMGKLFEIALNMGDDNIIGSESGIFGLFGCAIGFLILNWKNLEYEHSPRAMWSC